MVQRTLPGQGLTGFWALGYDGWKDEMDANLLKTSALLQLKVLDRVAAVPGSPTNGDIYLLTSAPNDQNIAVRDNGAWTYYAPFAGWIAWVADEAVPYVYNGSAWVSLSSLLTGSLNAVLYMGVIDCSANPNYPAADAGNMYIVSVAGKIGGASGTNVEAGDLIICKTDSTASGTEAGVGAQWDQVQKNLDGAVIGPASVTDGNPSVFDGTTGKLLKQQTFAQFAASLLSAAKATAANVWANVADKFLTSDIIWTSAAPVTLTDAATIAVDMSTFINAKVTLGGNRTLGQPSNPKPGQSGCIEIIQDGTGTRTLAYHADWYFAGGTDPVLTTTAGARDLLFYNVMNDSKTYGTLVKAVA